MFGNDREATVNMKASFELFVAAIVFGMGFHIGWGLIALLVWAAAQALGHDVPILR